jgi:very-long-chain (3R)-3-hydroxyacyl-CoA dehydratase
LAQTGNHGNIPLNQEILIKLNHFQICSPQKPNFLKIDFDRWQSEDKDDDEEEPRDVMKDYPNLYGNLEKEELGFRKEQGKLVYLILYNLFQFVGFLYILIVISVRYYRDGPGSYKGTYEAVGNAFKFVQLLQYLEVMHPIFGYTKGSWTVPFMQVSGRAFVLFAMLDCEPRMQTKPVVFYLFTVWALVEVVRYPYYISSLIKREVGFLTWLRYTIWIPLYPLGALCEAIIILRNIPYFEETGRFSVTMPNKWNVTFSMPIFMYIYLVVLILPGIYYVMKHMQRARAKKLGKKNKFI